MTVKSLTGSRWLNVDEDSEEFGLVCTVLNGVIDPSYNGDNDIEIQYQDGAHEIIKLRRFQSCFEKIIKTSSIKEQYDAFKERKQIAQRMVDAMDTAIKDLQIVCPHTNMLDSDKVRSCPDCHYIEYKSNY